MADATPIAVKSRMQLVGPVGLDWVLIRASQRHYYGAATRRGRDRLGAGG